MVDGCKVMQCESVSISGNGWWWESAEDEGDGTKTVLKLACDYVPWLGGFGFGLAQIRSQVAESEKG